MVQAQFPYRQFLGDSWLEKKTIPKWEKLFKAWGIYNKDFHDEYRSYIHGERYKTYIDLVSGDIRESIESISKDQIKECLKEFFWKKEFVCPDLLK